MDNVITITSAAAGTGKTTVATNLSAILQSRGHKTCLLDLSPNRGATLYHFPVTGPQKTIICWSDVQDYNRAVSELVLPGLAGIHIVPGPALPEQMGLITPTLAESVIEALSKHYDAVVIDLGNPSTFENILSMSRVILVSTPDPPTLLMTKKLYTKNCLLLVNKHRLGQGRKVRKILGTKPAGYIPDRTDLLENALRQRPRAFPFSSKRIQKHFNRLFPNNLNNNRKKGKTLKAGRQNTEPVIVYSSNQVINEAKKATRPLIVVDANHINPSLAIALGVPIKQAWKHDWRAGVTAIPYRIEKGFDVYTLDPDNKTGFDDRDNLILKTMLDTLTAKYRTVIVNLPNDHAKNSPSPETPPTIAKTIATAKPTDKPVIPNHPKVAIRSCVPEVLLNYIYGQLNNNVTLIDCDESLAPMLNISPDALWEHDWRIGLMAVPARITRKVLFYGMQNSTVEERDIRCLQDIIKAQGNRQILVYLGQNDALLKYLTGFKIVE